MGKDSICYYMYNIFTKKARFLLTKSLKKSINIPIGGVAQLVERWNHNPCVGGSIPSSATRFLLLNFFLIVPNIFATLQTTGGGL